MDRKNGMSFFMSKPIKIRQQNVANGKKELDFFFLSILSQGI